MTQPRQPPAPRVSFVIPVRNAATHLPQCLSSIAANLDVPGDCEILAVDNGSSDASAPAAPHLPQCLSSIAANLDVPGDCEILVVDNGSSDASADIARRFGALVIDRPDVRVGGCRNAGAAVS